jgi:L-2-hydroxyglutarate oxidase
VTDDVVDVVIVGGGLVGLATAKALLAARPELRLTILEKEAAIAQHQSSHNSGVVHAGVYYAPGSNKARFCTAGRLALEEYAAERGIPIQRLGKLVVAVREDELGRLDNLVKRAEANGLTGLELLDGAGLREYEPHIAGIRALRVPQSGVIDFALVAQEYATDVRQAGGEIALGAALEAVDHHSDGLTVTAGGRTLHTRFLVTCAGLQSDRVARLAGVDPGVSIIPFRGDWYTLSSSSAALIRSMIYPVPDPELPFLGVHLTRRIDGAVWAGPNAVLSLAREGYGRHDFKRRDAGDVLRDKGFRKLARRWWKTGAGELWRAASKRAYLRSVLPYMPSLQLSDLESHFSGIRAQAVARDGSMVDDFHLVEAPRALHVVNAPSPAATASLAIGKHLSERALAGLDA